MSHQSDSSAQRDAEALIRGKVAEQIGRSLSPATVEISGGTGRWG